MRIFASLLFALFFSLSPPSSFGADEHSPDIKRILQRGKLIVAMVEEDMPPFFMHDKAGTFYGMDVELARDLAKRMGVKVEFDRSAKTFNEVVERVAQDKADVAISKLSKTTKRALRVRYTDIYATIHQVLLVNRLAEVQLKRGSDPTKMLNHPDINIGAPGGTSYVGYVRRDYPKAKIKEYEGRFVMMEDVLKNKIPAALVAEDSAKDWFFRNPEAAIKVRMVLRADRKDPKAFAVHWRNTHLLSWLNIYLETASLDGTLPNLMETYFEKDEWRARQN